MGGLSFCVVLLTITHLSHTMDVFPKCQDSNNTAKSCCPCFRDLMDSCNETCPEDYLIVKKQADSFSCDPEPSSTPETSTITTVQTVEATDNTLITTTVDVTNVTFNSTEEEKGPYFMCYKSCPKSHFYNNETMECVECDKRCMECETDGETCLVCRFSYNDTCYAQCPDGMIGSGQKAANGSVLCVKEPETEDKSSNLPAIIGGSVGGVAVVVIVGVVIVWLYCRRRKSKDMAGGQKKKRTAMSMHLEEQQSAGDSRREGKRKIELQEYENTSLQQQQPSAKEIQEHGDNVLRYTRDPTSKPNKGPEVSEPELEIYENRNMIRLQQNVDTSGRREEELNELLDVQDLGEAPAAPGPAQAKVSLPVSKKAGKKTGIVKSLSQRVSERLGLKKGKKVPKKQNELENYMDMTQGSAASGKRAESDYENIQFDKMKQGRKAVSDPADDMEVYENPKPDQSRKNKVDNADLEDYENTKDVLAKMTVSEKVTDDGSGDMEDYENMEVYENTRMSKATK